MLLILLGVLTVLLLHYYNYYRDPRRVIDKRFPGPFALPILGNALVAACSTEGKLNYFKYSQLSLNFFTLDYENLEYNEFYHSHFIYRIRQF